MKTKLLLTLVLIMAARMLYAGTPVINSFSPAIGNAGTLVTIKGANLDAPTVFKIGNKAAIVISNNGTTLVGMVMPGAVTGAISVTTANGTAASAGNFTVGITTYPSQQQGPELQAASPSYYGFQSCSIALSADGNTAIIGASDDEDAGAAFIYTRNAAGAWAEAQKLQEPGWVIQSFLSFGEAVAMSADGNTALVGDPAYNNGKGITWVYTRGAGGAWANILSIPGTNRNAPQGSGSGAPLAISADGHTILIGETNDNNHQGGIAAYSLNGATLGFHGVFLGNDNSTENNQGATMAMSADGKTMIESGIPQYTTPINPNEAWVFVYSGGQWVQQGAKLTIAGVVIGQNDEYNLAMSADGNTALIGSPTDNNLQGGTWVFTRSGTTWSQQAKLFGSGAVGAATQGISVALSADGSIAMVGGYTDQPYNNVPENPGVGATWVFARNNDGTWSQPIPKLVGISNLPEGQEILNQGGTLALSADGNTSIIGVPNQIKGAFFMFASVPQQAQAINFNPPAPVNYGTADFAPAAVSTNPTIPITYTSSKPTVATVTAGGLIHTVGVGNTIITASQAGNATYLPAASVAQNLTVNKGALTITADNKTKVLGTANPVLTVTYSGFANGDTPASLTTLPSVSTTATTGSPVGAYPIKASGAASPNYTITYMPGQLKVTDPPVTFNAIPAQVYGAADFDPGATSSWAVTYTSSHASVATIVSGKIHIVGVGTTNITASNGGIGTGAVQSLVVQKAPLTITADDKTKVQGTANPTLTASYSGFVYSDSQASLTTPPVLSTTAITSSPVGSYSIKIQSAAAVNYAINYVYGTLTITASGSENVPQPAILAASFSQVTAAEPTIKPAISPNGDGMNDVLTIDNIKNYPQNKLMIMNSNGVKIFERSAYDNVNNLFDGRSNITGALQQPGTYFYKLQYYDKGLLKVKTGYLVIKY